MAIPYVLDFEKPLIELEKRIAEAEAAVAAGGGPAPAADETEAPVQPDVPVKIDAKRPKAAASKNTGTDPAGVLAELKATHASELVRVYSNITAWQPILWQAHGTYTVKGFDKC